jgi:hypothetical protein
MLKVDGSFKKVITQQGRLPQLPLPHFSPSALMTQTLVQVTETANSV